MARAEFSFDNIPSGRAPLDELSSNLEFLDVPLPTSILGYNKDGIYHLLDRCSVSKGDLEELDFTALRTFNMRPSKADSLCQTCLSMILSAYTPPKYLWGTQDNDDSPARQLRTISFASSLLVSAIKLRSTAPDSTAPADLAYHAMAVLRSNSRLFGWRNRLVMILKQDATLTTISHLLSELDFHLARPWAPAAGPSNADDLAVAITKTLVLNRKSRSCALLTPQAIAGMIRRAASRTLPTPALNTLLASSVPARATKPTIRNPYSLVFLPHIPEVPLASAFLIRTCRMANSYLISGFALMPTSLLTALAISPNRFPKIEDENVTDSTSRGCERASYDYKTTVIPVAKITSVKQLLSYNDQVLDLGLYLWSANADDKGHQVGTDGWADMAADSIFLAKAIIE